MLLNWAQVRLQHEELPAHGGVDDAPQQVPAETVLPQRRLLPVLVAAPPDPLRERLLPAAAQSVGGKARKAPGGYARV